MLWTRLRDSVSVALLPPPRQPKTHAGTHTTSFSLSLILFFLSASFADNTGLFFYQTEIYLSCVLHVSITCWVIAVYCNVSPLFSLRHLKQPQSHASSGHSGKPLTVPSLSVLSPSILLYEVDKCIGYWLSPMPTSTSIHPFPGPLPCPLSTSCPAGGGVSLAGLGARQATSGLWRAAAPRPSPCSLAPAGVSSGSSGCQSDLTPTERKKKTPAGRNSRHFCSANWTMLQKM